MTDASIKPVLRGNGVTLRPIGLADAPALYEATLDEEGRRLTGTRRSFTLEEIERWCAGLADRDDRIDMAIVRREDGELLGEVVLNEIDHIDMRANFRISLSSTRHFGRGYGSEAASLLLAHGFEVLALRRVELEVFRFNPRAIRVYEKLGFRHEGVRREAHCMDGAYHDVLVMGMLRHEFVPQPG